MPQVCQIERSMEIDAGHRVTNHRAECENLHGHRYRIDVACEGELGSDGASEGMVLDFGFLKELMIEEIHRPADHSLILWIKDPLTRLFVNDDKRLEEKILPLVEAKGYARIEDGVTGALYIIDGTPTAENLAAHWYARLAPRVKESSKERVTLKRVRVYETPSCSASFPA